MAATWSGLITPAVASDAAAVTEVVDALESSLYSKTAFSQADLEAEWAELDIERDTLVVRDGDRVVGYAAVRERGELWRVEGYVHPDQLGKGFGTYRRGAGEGRGPRRRPQDPQRGHRADYGRRDAARVARLRRRARLPRAARRPGGTPARCRMAGRAARDRFDPDDDAVAFHAAHQEAFSDHWGYTRRDFETWSNLNLRSERFDPSLWCVVRAGDEIAAGTICTGDTYGGGWVHTLFTRRPWRRQGVGAALLRDVFGRFWERGERSVGLGVDAASETGAFRLYERAGMAPVLGWVVYEKKLGQSSGSA